MGLMGHIRASYYGGLWGILSGLTKSTDHPRMGPCSYMEVSKK